MTTYLLDESGVVQFMRGRSTATSAAIPHEIANPFAQTRCTQCAAVVGLRKLFTHLVVAHGFTQPMAERMLAEACRAPEPSHAGSQTSRLPTTHFGHAITGSGADPLDGGRGLGHFARERGRFGSMPSFDDYDH